MNFLEKSIARPSYHRENNSLVSKLSYVLNACECSKNLMIAIYLVNKGHFLYCNDKFRVITGYDYNNLILDGWNYWFSLIAENEVPIIKNQLSNLFTSPYIQDSLTIRYHINSSDGNIVCLKHEIVLHQLEHHHIAINYFFDISDTEKVERCFKELSLKLKTKCSLKKPYLSISPREKEVLKLIADGYSSKEVAEKLYISNHTAISHRKNLIEKFQVKNTAHLIKRAATFICL